jgi:serine/threonine protein kinase
MSHEKTMEVSIPTPLIDNMTISHVIDKGGSGIVYKGCQQYLQRDIAIKLLHLSPNDEAFAQRFQREAQLLAQLSHPNIVSCYQAGMTEKTSNFNATPYIAMEFIDGPSLLNYIAEQGKLEPKFALQIIIDIAQALDYALQQGIIHRDIKAENILFKKCSQHKKEGHSHALIPKLADLGIARTCQNNSTEDLTVAGSIMGTPSSMAPEQFNDPDHVDFKVDIYGLGCVLFHMLTGEKPFYGLNITDLIISKNSNQPPNPKNIEQSLDNTLTHLVMRMLAKNKKQRPESYQTLIIECENLIKQSNHKISKKNATLVYLLIIIGLFFTSWLIYSTYLFPQKSLFSSTSMDQQKSVRPKSSIDTQIEITDQSELIEITSKPLFLETEQNQLEINYFNPKQNLLLPGKSFNITILSNLNAYLYCYFEKYDKEIIRFFPNRFEQNAQIIAQIPLILPGQFPFEMNINEQGLTERIACFTFEQDIADKISAKQFGIDFESLDYQSLEEIGQSFNKFKDHSMIVEYFTLDHQ